MLCTTMSQRGAKIVPQRGLFCSASEEPSWFLFFFFFWSVVHMMICHLSFVVMDHHPDGAKGDFVSLDVCSSSRVWSYKNKASTTQEKNHTVNNASSIQNGWAFKILVVAHQQSIFSKDGSCWGVFCPYRMNGFLLFRDTSRTLTLKKKRHNHPTMEGNS